MGDYIRELVGQERDECPECGAGDCTFDHDADAYDPNMVSDPSMWPPWWTRDDAQRHHDEMMPRKAKLDGEQDHKRAEVFARSLLDKPSTKGALRNLCLCYLNDDDESTGVRQSEPAGPRITIPDVEVPIGAGWGQCPLCGSTIDVYDDKKLRCRDDDCDWIEKAVSGCWRDGNPR